MVNGLDASEASNQKLIPTILFSALLAVENAFVLEMHARVMRAFKSREVEFPDACTTHEQNSYTNLSLPSRLEGISHPLGFVWWKWAASEKWWHTFMRGGGILLRVFSLVSLYARLYLVAGRKDFERGRTCSKITTNLVPKIHLDIPFILTLR